MGKYAFDQDVCRKVCIRDAVFKRAASYGRSLTSSGSNQARKGRLVNALAVRGDEGRDTLR